MFADVISVFVTHPNLKIIYKHANEDLNSIYKYELNFFKLYQKLNMCCSKQLILNLHQNEKKLKKSGKLIF